MSTNFERILAKIVIALDFELSRVKNLPEAASENGRLRSMTSEERGLSLRSTLGTNRLPKGFVKKS